MKHIILTKFAVSFDPTNARKHFEGQDTWIANRMALFNKYCLPSMKAQTFKDFDWLFIASPNFKNFDKAKPELERYGKIVYTEAYWQDGLSQISDTLGRLYGGSGWVCTTRLDSDDIVSSQFMAKTNEAFSEREEWLSFFLGYYLLGDIAILARVAPNPFLSLVENSDNGIRSVYEANDHTRATKYAQRRSIPFRDIGESIPMWIHVFHGGNVKYKTSCHPWPELGRGPAAELLKGFVYER